MCVDGDFEASSKDPPGDKSQAVFYLTEYQCGALQCEPGKYAQYAEVTCVVCSK